VRVVFVMKKFLSVALGLAAGATIALAASNADANGRRSIKDEPGPAPFSWTGFYLGGHAGYSWSDADWLFHNGNLRTSSADDTPIVGVQVGYQHQFGSVVVGVEAGFTSTASAGSTDDLCTFNQSFFCEHSVDNIATIGGRLGLALFPRALPYITGGYASANIDDRAIVATGPNTGNVFWSSDDRHSGWYIGGGLDWAVHAGWTIGVEYRHYQFDDSFRIPVTPAAAQVVADRHDLDVTVDTLTVRLNYKFGPIR
jgi:outer membrane immunogenic protein